MVNRASKLVVDSWEQNVHRGQLVRLVERGVLNRGHLWAELGDIVAGIKPGRQTDSEVIVACIIGMGSLDVALAKQAYDRARDRGIGAEFSFF